MKSSKHRQRFRKKIKFELFALSFQFAPSSQPALKKGKLVSSPDLEFLRLLPLFDLLSKCQYVTVFTHISKSSENQIFFKVFKLKSFSAQSSNKNVHLRTLQALSALYPMMLCKFFRKKLFDDLKILVKAFPGRAPW